MSSLKNALFILACGVFLYYNVDDKTRTRFDNGIEFQTILYKELKHKAYMGLWEFFGAHEEEIAQENSRFNGEMNQRKRLLKESQDRVDDNRTPAEADAHKYDKYLAK